LIFETDDNVIRIDIGVVGMPSGPTIRNSIRN